MTYRGVDPHATSGGFEVSGLRMSIESIRRQLRDKGFEISPTALHRRLQNGAHTWEQLMAPKKNRGPVGQNRNLRDKNEMRALIARIDARKATL